MRFISLVRSDIEFQYGSVNRASLFRSLLNPGVRAAFWIRVAASPKKWLHVIARNRLISKYSIDVGYGVRIGPSLRLPHPFGIVIGDQVEIKGCLVIYHNCTLGNKLGYPTVEEDVTIFPGSCIVGNITVGKGSKIGAMSFIDKAIPAGTTFRPNR